MGNYLHIEDNNLQIKGAKKVVSSTQSQAVVETDENTIIITGNEIEVKRLNLDEGEVLLSGKFGGIKFSSSSGKKQPILKRIFK